MLTSDKERTAGAIDHHNPYMSKHHITAKQAQISH